MGRDKWPIIVDLIRRSGSWKESWLEIATFKDNGKREESNLVIRLQGGISIMLIQCAMLKVGVGANMRTNPKRFEEQMVRIIRWQKFFLHRKIRNMGIAKFSKFYSQNRNPDEFWEPKIVLV